MKTKLKFIAVCPLLSALCFSGHTQGTGFTYQGRLVTNSAAFSGSAEFQFTLWDSVSGGNSVATNNPASLIATVDNNGLFTVTLDFGINPFNGQPRFLQTDVRTAIGPFTTLTPRQPVTATPYALRALSLTTNGLAGAYGNAVTFNNAGNNFVGGFAGAFTGTASGDGAGLTNVSATTLGGLSSANFWKTNGNAGANPTNGAFLGTTDNLPLEFKVNGQRGFRLEPNASGPNVIGGDAGNSLATGVSGATIGGGSGNRIFLSVDPFATGYSVIGGGIQNLIGGTPGSGLAAFGGCNFVGGGIQNVIKVGGDFDTISGGDHNTTGTNADYVTIAGGSQNRIGNDSSGSVISGGTGNVIGTNSLNGVIGGGNNNTITNNSAFAMIPGGELNAATNYALAAGRRAKANHQGAFVWADSQNADFASTSSNQFLIRAIGGVGVGTGNPSRELEVQHAGDTEIGIKSTDANGHLWTLQSSAVAGSASTDASFQIIDRTLGSTRLFIGTNGFVGIGTSSPTNKLHVAGGVSATVFVTTSDRNVKENFTTVSARDILEKVIALPVTRSSFKEMPGALHIGPMAQDFYAAFQVGSGSTGIATVDADGVALAAIQGLNQKLEEQRAENAALQQRLDALEKIIHSR